MSSQKDINTATGSLFFQQDISTDLLGEWAQSKNVHIAELDPKGWIKLVFLSSEPLLGETRQSDSAWEYFYFVRKGARGHLLLVSTHSDLVDKLLQGLGAENKLLKPLINIQRIVIDLAKKPARYAMSTVYARIEGYGQSLKSIAFYGNDLGEAGLFRDLLPTLTPHRVTLREITKRLDVISVGSRGEVSFLNTGINSFIEVDKSLHFLAHTGYLDWSVND